jgi:hypothetical protein
MVELDPLAITIFPLASDDCPTETEMDPDSSPVELPLPIVIAPEGPAFPDPLLRLTAPLETSVDADVISIAPLEPSALEPVLNKIEPPVLLAE